MQKSIVTPQLVVEADLALGNRELESEFNGICLVCQNSPTCTFPRDSSRPISSCDEFEGAGPLNRAQMKVPQVKLPRIAINKKAESPENDFAGLCINCDHREDCQFPKPEGGVWNCDEYK